MPRIITIIGFKDMKKNIIIFIHSNICTMILSQSIKTTTILFMALCQFIEIEPIGTLLDNGTIVTLKLKIVEAWAKWTPPTT